MEEQVRPARGMVRLHYEDDRRPLLVKVEPGPGYRELKCWFNALQHATMYGGGPIFGWSIWKRADDRFFAQHHAVWRSDLGDYLDVTPNDDLAKCILFIPDGRAPFDYFGYRRPFDFEMWQQKVRWSATGGRISSDFAIGILSPSEEDLMSDSAIVAAAVKAGVFTSSP